MTNREQAIKEMLAECETLKNKEALIEAFAMGESFGKSEVVVLVEEEVKEGDTKICSGCGEQNRFCICEFMSGSNYIK